MGVRTEADERLDSAREHVHQAVSDLCAIVVDECWGHESFTPECRATLERAFNTLREVRAEMGR